MNSNLFNQFLADRPKIGAQLANARGSYSSKVVTPGVGIDGYSNNQQDVLLGAFYNTYTGRTIKNYSTTNIFPTIPLPNWTVSWDGLGKIPALKKTFKSVTIRHGYKSSYRVSSYSNNILFNTTDQTQNVRNPVTLPAGSDTLNPQANNFVSRYNINSVTISEAFSPLIKFDLQFVKTGWSGNIEVRRDKTSTLNITGLQIIETKGQEYILGAGYMIPKLKIQKYPDPG